MRKTWGVTFIALAVVVACASRATTAQTPGGQAAARVTVEQHEGFMKTISSTNAALAKKIMGNELAEAAKDAQVLATTFGDVEKFWAQNNKADAVTWAQLGQDAGRQPGRCARRRGRRKGGRRTQGDGEQLCLVPQDLPRRVAADGWLHAQGRSGRSLNEKKAQCPMLNWALRFPPTSVFSAPSPGRRRYVPE